MLQGCSRGPLQSSMGDIGEVFTTAGLSPGLYDFIVCLAACILVTLSITAFFSGTALEHPGAISEDDSAGLAMKNSTITDDFYNEVVLFFIASPAESSSDMAPGCSRAVPEVLFRAAWVTSAFLLEA
jgi:hypothetical protein